MQHAKSSFPQLSLSHLISWTAFSAIGMMVGLVASRTVYANEPNSMQLYLRSSMVYQAIFFGAAIVGVSIGVGRWRRGERYPVSPGHWVLFFLVFYQLAQALIVGTDRYAVDLMENSYTITSGVGFSVVGLLATLAFMQFRDLAWWNAYFGLYSVVSIASALFHIVFVFDANTIGQFEALMQVVHWLATMAMVGAVAIDLSKGRKWDWLHWVGAAYSIVGIFFSAAAFFIAAR